MANPSPICEVKEGSGAWQSTADGVDVTAGSSLTIRLVDTSAYAWSIECIGTDETNDLVTVNAGLSVTTTTKQATLTAPASAGSALIFRSTVNGGFSTDGTARASYSTTFKISVPTSNGSRVGAVGETTENDSNFGFAPIINGLVRTVDGTQQALVDTSLSGWIATWFLLDGGSAAVNAGDSICTVPNVPGSVTRSTAAALALSGFGGLVLRAAGPGGRALVAVAGIVPNSITGLDVGSYGPTVVDPTTGRLQRASTGVYAAGTCDTAGNAFIATGLQGGIYTLNVRAFGAVGDGVTDDIAAFNAVIAAKEALVAAGKTVEIYIPAGQYRLSTAWDIGTRACIIRGDGYHYVHANARGDAAWLVLNDYVNGVVGTVLRWPNATNGMTISSYPCSGIVVKDMALVGPGSGQTTGFYEAAATATINLVLERMLIGNWYRGLDQGGVEEARFNGIRVFGCDYGVILIGTPQKTGGATNSAYRDLQVQTCTIGAYIKNPTGVHFDGGATLFQANGKSLTVLGVSNTTPIVVQVSSTIGIETGMKCDVSGVTGTTNANVTDGAFTVVDSTHISLDGTVGNGAWTGGGTIKIGGGVLFQPTIEMLATAPTGTAPPAVTLTGTCNAQNTTIEIDITTGGARGAALFTWKLNGAVQATGQTTAATFVLGSTGLTANFPVGTYTNDNVYVWTAYGGQVIEFSISEAWFEGNKRFGIMLDLSPAGVGVTGLKLDRCRLSDAQNTLSLSATVGSGSGANRTTLRDCYPGGVVTIPASGAITGVDIGAPGMVTNNYPAGWASIDSTQVAAPTLKANTSVLGAYVGQNTGTLATSGFVRLPTGNVTAVNGVVGSTNSPAVSWDSSNSIYFGDRASTGWVDGYLWAKNRVFLGNSTSAFGHLFGAGYEKAAWPLLGGDGTDSVPNSMFSAHGLASAALGDADANIANTQYSRERWEWTGALTAVRTYTAPTPTNANGYVEKTVYNNTTGGFDIIVKCGAGTTVRVPPGKTLRVGLKSTGDVVDLTPVPAGGTFTLTAAVTSTVTDKRVTANSIIVLMPTNAAAATLMGSAKALYISARTAQTSFAVSTANAVAAAGTETFSYAILEAA